MKQSQYSQKMVIIDLTKNQVEQMVICFPRRTPIQKWRGCSSFADFGLTSVVWDGKYLNMLIQVSLKAVHKEICKKKKKKKSRDADLTEISFRVSLSLKIQT